MLLYGVKFPEKTRRGLLSMVYHNWIKVHLREGPDSLVAVQAIRNQIMGSSIFISALLVLLGIVLGLYTIFPEGNVVIFLFAAFSLISVQITLITLIIVFCLFNFIYSVRMAVRLTFLITADPEKVSLNKMDALKFTADSLTSLQNHWMFGIRGIFFLIPTLTWLLNPLFFIIGTICVTIYLVFFQDIWILSS